MKLNVGCGTFYAEHWTNTDFIAYPGHREPDVYVTADDPFPFDDDSFTHVYLGHVLEHVPWDDCHRFLAEVARVLVDDGQACFVGPDVLTSIAAYRDGLVSWEWVCATLEGPGPYLQDVDEWEPLRWGGDRHHWNCYEDRVAALLVDQGWTAGIVPRTRRYELDPAFLSEWPVVACSPGQFAIVGTP